MGGKEIMHDAIRQEDLSDELLSAVTTAVFILKSGLFRYGVLETIILRYFKVKIADIEVSVSG